MGAVGRPGDGDGRGTLSGLVPGRPGGGQAVLGGPVRTARRMHPACVPQSHRTHTAKGALDVDRGLWVPPRQGGLIHRDHGATLVGMSTSGEACTCGGGGSGEITAPSSRFCFEAVTALKIVY